jgi:short-chain fatty acids transporter
VSVEGLARAIRALTPDPFPIALGLTLLAFALAMAFGDASLPALLDGWADPERGIWSQLAFAMQMCLILLTGYAVAGTRPVQRVLAAIARIPRNGGEAAVLVSLGAMALALVNWGLGLIGGALLAREVGMSMRERGLPVHYPLLAAAGYTGLGVWHGGLSGSAPLKVTQMSDLEKILGKELAAAIGVIPLDHTILSTRNLLTTGALLIAIPAVLYAIAPRDASRFEPPPERSPSVALPQASRGWVATLENGPWLIAPIALLMGWWLVRWASAGGWRALDPNEVNFAFLAIGLVLAGSPARYMALADDAGRACAGIIVQFPLYGGIVGVLVTSGLVPKLAALLPHGPGLPFATFLSAAVVNVFIPSGGGQWTVQGPILMQAAHDAGVDPGRVVLALAYGDEWTNLLQPFWALPLLGITGAKIGDIFGYTAILCAAVSVIFAAGVILG